MIKASATFGDGTSRLARSFFTFHHHTPVFVKIAVWGGKFQLELFQQRAG